MLFRIVIILVVPVSSLRADVNFTRDVRPILSNHCFQCHGPDDDKREADLRLDTQSGINAIVDRDDIDASEILQRIHSSDEDLAMPPAATNKPLSAEQKQILTEWVRAGAPWEQHWAFVAPQRLTVPESSSPWPRNEIDGFLLARMNAAGLEPAAEADPYTQVRRLYLDLTGLPPTPDEADQWVERIWPGVDIRQPPESWRSLCDESAWQLLIDELLNSSAYAERWARRWLDLARYSDTNGYEKDRDRSIWPYRDWVIQAIQNDMPFDQFTIEQLAGDMLPDADRSRRVATGFHRNTMLNEEGGIDPLEFRFHAMTDRVATTGTTWLGLTTGCAQCHTHKYDPISHREYYQLMAFLNNADEPTLLLTDESHRQETARRNAQADQLTTQLAAAWPQDAPALDDEFAGWLAAERAFAADWKTVRPTAVRSSLPVLTIEEDDAVFASGDTAKRDDYWISLPAVPYPVNAIQLETLPDERLPASGPGTTYYEGTIGDFFLAEFVVSTAAGKIPLSAASHSYANDRFGKGSDARRAIDGDIQSGWSVHDRQGERHTAVFQLNEPIPPDTPFEVQMTFGRHFASSLGRFRFQVTSAAGDPRARPYDADITAILNRPADSLTADETQRLRTEFLLNAPQLEEQQKQIAELRKPLAVPTTLVMQELPEKHPRKTFRHHRGEYLQPREEVQPGPLDVLHEFPSSLPHNRLGFAKWLADPRNPLTPRVVVNRHWAAIFGTGLVRTVEDLGLQGESPSHPELLDWLAVTFVEDDAWSLRRLHRRIVSSSAWRQSAVTSDRAAEHDPENRLLSHSTRVRLDAEVIRDRLLVAAEVLNPAVGGPSVRPPQPDGVQDAAYSRGAWKADEGDARYRRSLYTYSRRTAPFAMLGTFDAPTGESCVARRNRSNNPLQALTLLNDVMFMELARIKGRQLVAQEATDAVRVEAAFRRVLVRPPTPDEQQRLERFVTDQRSFFSGHPEEAARLMESPEDQPAADAVEPAIWTATARALFALDEVVMRE